jgi:hypothetical protein
MASAREDSEMPRLVAFGRAAVWLAIAGAGVVVVAAILRPDGVSIGGSACGGGGASQVCREIDRELSITDLHWFSWATLAGGVVLVLAGIVGAAVSSARRPLGIAVLVLALAGLVGVAHVDNRFCPGGESLGTCGRADEAWGPVLEGPLLDLRRETRAMLVGRPAQPGGPEFEAEQTLQTFRARALGGFELLTRAVLGLVFLGAFLVARPAIASLPLALVATVTAGGVVSIAAWDLTGTCAEDSSECWRGLFTAGAVVAAALVWAAVGAVIVVARQVRRLPRRPGRSDNTM